MFDLKEPSHTRYNILTGDWILVSPHHTKRPWQDKVESLPVDKRPSYDPSCYLCAGNRRADRAINPNYTSPFAFTNDYAFLLPDTLAGIHQAPVNNGEYPGWHLHFFPPLLRSPAVKKCIVGCEMLAN